MSVIDMGDAFVAALQGVYANHYVFSVDEGFTTTGFTGNDFDVVFSVIPVADITPINADHDSFSRSGQFPPVTGIAKKSPGSVTEKLYFYIAEYHAEDKASAGGGIAAEGEDIEVLELPLDAALAAVESGLIVDGKTIMLLYHVALK